MSTGEVLIQIAVNALAGFIGAWLGGWSFSRHEAKQRVNAVKRLIARSLDGAEVDETKPHRRTIIRKH